MFPDLFPETLLVDVADGQAFTTSLKVAEHFHKEHKNVLRAIEQALADLTQPPLRLPTFGEFSGLNFEPAKYLDRQKKPRLMYRLTRSDFMMVVMGFTGAQARRWQRDFIIAFNQMESQLRAKTELAAAALHQLRPVLGPVIAGTEQGLSRAEIGAGVGRSKSSITYHRRCARSLGLLPQPAAKTA